MSMKAGSESLPVSQPRIGEMSGLTGGGGVERLSFVAL